MSRFRFSLANLMLFVLFIGGVCASLHYARRAGQLQSDLESKERQMVAVTTALEHDIQVVKNFANEMVQKEFESVQKLEDHKAKAAGAAVQFQEFQLKVANLLSEAIKDDRPAVRLRAARMLGEIGPGTREALDSLEALLEDQDEDVRKAAADALKRIEAN